MTHFGRVLFCQTILCSITSSFHDNDNPTEALFPPVMSQQTQQMGATAPDSPLVAVTSSVQKYAIKKKKFLTAEENELFGLAKAAGITIDQEVFQIVVDLLKMNVAPNAVFQTLKTMCACIKVTESSTESSHTASTTAAPAEVKEEESLVSGKSSKPTAAHHSASAPRSSRVNTKIVVYGPQDASSAHSQVRNKPKASQSEKSREPSSQKVQRQPSATRGQKTKSSGSSSSSSQINSS